MKKILPLLVVGILVLGGLGAVSGTESEKSEIISEKIAFSQPIVSTNDEFVNINVEETNSFITEQGKPLLPCYNDRFTFPFGTKINSVTCNPTEFDTQTVSSNIQPTPQIAIAGQTIMKTKEELVNYGNEVYPSDWFEYKVSGGLVNGELGVIVDVQINPVRYNPVEDTIKYAKNAEIKIDYKLPIDQPSSRDDFELIVIGPSDFSDELSDLIDWKIDNGMTAKFVSLTDTYSSPGRDNQEKIKYYIKDAVENSGTNYVLFVGDRTKFPTRDVHINIAEQGDNEIFVSDLYYADLYDGEGGFASWDTNDNDIFGEYDWSGEYDEMDLHPDVYYGRLAATSGSQVTTVVDKIIQYEYDHAYEQNWFKDVVVVGGDSFPDDDDYLEGEDGINQRVMDMLDGLGFSFDKQWVTNGKLTQPFLGVTNLKNAINAGCGFVDFSGHGNPASWATHPEKTFSKWVPTPTPPGGILNIQVQTLSNGDELPIVVVEACSTAKFKSNTNCFNWAWLNAENGGAIATFGATALGWGYVGTYVYYGGIGKMGLDTFRGYAFDDARTLGEMYAFGQERFITGDMDVYDLKTLLEWQMFGDPSLKIGPETGAPEQPAKPSGPPSGTTGNTYTYSTSTTDPDNDKISYLFDWGDGTDSGWIGPYNSGETVSASHSWSNQNTFQVKVKAKDVRLKESPWSDPLSVNIPRNRAFNGPIIQFLQNHPNLFPILRQLLGL